MKFDREGDAKLYVAGSVVMFKGRPAMIEGTAGKDRRTVYLWAKRLHPMAELFRIRADDPQLSNHAPKLGYINEQGHAKYIKRWPVRHYKRGVCRDNTPGIGELHRTLVNIHQQVYPSLSVALSAIQNGIAKSCAFSRNFAISKSELFFKEKVVGVTTKTGVKLNKDFVFLNRQLKEDMYG